ncbi:MAG: molybdate ABC transporter substrate-binding protein [Gammaproteobacteria bacterium]|nr:molybdate ABC transporter substrate-binding protein [Gammaproteobacteria bacterium]
MRFIALLLACVLHTQALAKDNSLLLAVASNFASPMQALAKQFESETGITLKVSLGSSGKHFAQISNGAPYDLFLAADAERPALLEAKNIGLPNSRFTYAIGQLALWQLGATEQVTANQLTDATRIAIANPKLAPYGLAAIQTLEKLGLQSSLKAALVTAENVSQARQYVYSRNAALGFVALSQVLDQPASEYWLVPQHYHQAIEQQAIVLSDRPEAQQLKAFLLSPATQRIIERYGYLTD